MTRRDLILAALTPIVGTKPLREVRAARQLIPLQWFSNTRKAVLAETTDQESKYGHVTATPGRNRKTA
jgi:hypothetical protein